MKAGIVIFPGTNCDRDCYDALSYFPEVKADYVWHDNTDLSKYDLIILPGGFSYGDYLRAGAIAGTSPVMNAVKSFADNGGLVLGICNGFQILTEIGLLPGCLIRNRDLKFVCRDVYLRVDNLDTPFTSEYVLNERVKFNIAHASGCYYAEKSVIDELESNNQIIFRYCDENGEINEESNPNGSIGNIAGVINEKRNVLGMMPHPERSISSLLGGQDGLKLFSSILLIN